MALKQHGNGDYKFAFDDPAALTLAAAVGIKPQTLSLKYAPEFTAEAQGETGETESVVVGEDMIDFTLTGMLVDGELFEEADAFEYDGRYFIIMGRSKDLNHRDFVKAELTGKSYVNVTEAVTP